MDFHALIPHTRHYLLLEWANLVATILEVFQEQHQRSWRALRHLVALHAQDPQPRRLAAPPAPEAPRTPYTVAAVGVRECVGGQCGCRNALRRTMLGDIDVLEGLQIHDGQHGPSFA